MVRHRVCSFNPRDPKHSAHRSRRPQPDARYHQGETSAADNTLPDTRSWKASRLQSDSEAIQILTGDNLAGKVPSYFGQMLAPQLRAMRQHQYLHARTRSQLAGLRQ